MNHPLQALEKDPDDRYPDLAALAEAIAGALPNTSAVDSSAEVASLLIRGRQCSAKAGEPLALPESQETFEDLSRDRVLAVAPNDTLQAVSMVPEGLTVGRSSDNDLVLDSHKVSRHHARIEFNGIDYQVVDLGSLNGTYLGTIKLSPDQPEVWTPGTVLRIGSSYLRLERFGWQVGKNSEMSTQITVLDSGLIQTKSGQARAAILMKPTELSVAPGSQTTASLTILNLGTTVDRFTIAVRGVPGDWVSVHPRPSS